METSDFVQHLRKNFTYKNGVVLNKDGEDKATVTHQGYKQLYINGTPHLVHRLVFLMHNDEFPKVVDHINGDKKDNRIENLQGCTQVENIAKAKLFNTNKTGYKGVHYNKNAGKYEAYFWNNYKKYYLGLFDDPELAGLAVEEAKDNLQRKYGAA
jgi:hypothetical protein